jgi:hypothetical protein
LHVGVFATFPLPEPLLNDAISGSTAVLRAAAVVPLLEWALVSPVDSSDASPCASLGSSSDALPLELPVYELSSPPLPSFPSSEFAPDWYDVTKMGLTVSRNAVTANTPACARIARATIRTACGLCVRERLAPLAGQ